MEFSNFAVVHAQGNASVYGDPLVHCHAGKQLVLTYVAREALMDYFRVPGDAHISLHQWNLVVDRNLDLFKPIIKAKYEADDWAVYSKHQQTYPKLVITLEDMQRSSAKFSIDVLNLDAGFRRRGD